MSVSLARLVLLSAPLLLAACGEGWEAEKTDKILPYGNKRTAGSGVVYVRAQMMPEKELKLEPVKEVQPQEEVKPVLDAEEIFEDANVKGAAPAPKMQKDAAPIEPEAKSVSEELIETAIQKAPAVEEEPMDAVKPAEVQGEVVSSSADLEVPELSAEEYVANSPKQIEKPDIIVQDAAAEKVEEVSADVAHKIEEKHGEHAKELDHALVEADSHDGKSEVGTDEFVAPKKDILDFEPHAGEQSLNEIYSDPF